jgi:uncharacterized paraquat-inducible protein A
MSILYGIEDFVESGEYYVAMVLVMKYVSFVDMIIRAYHLHEILLFRGLRRPHSPPYVSHLLSVVVAFVGMS